MVGEGRNAVIGVSIPGFLLNGKMVFYSISSTLVYSRSKASATAL